MINLVNVFLIVMFLVFAAIIIGLVLYNLSFKNRVMIARQTGKTIDNVIWVVDKFKVVNNKGYYVIKFRNRRVKSPEVEGKFYSLFSKSAASIRMDKEQWDMQDMSKKIQRGLFMYETNEGQLFPMSLQVEDGNAKFLILGQDKRRWLTDEIKDINELTRNRTKDIMLLAAAIVACAVLAVIFIFGFIYLNEQGTKAIGANQVACTQYIDRLINYTQTVEERSGFIQGAQNALVGG